jgi:hypothetical protein
LVNEKLNASVRWYYEDVLDLLLKGQHGQGVEAHSLQSRKVNGFYNKKLGVVIKRPAFILEHRTPMQFQRSYIFSSARSMLFSHL